MESLSLREIAQAVEGQLSHGHPEMTVDTVSTDSRSLAPGALFVPLVGVRFDAHAFIPQAFAGGAAAVLAVGPPPERILPPGRGWIQVADTLRALQRLAAWYRRRFDIPVVGITGSVGKTSTKEMVADALAPALTVLRTRGNFNNEIGLPMTLLRLDPTHAAAVVEMGTDRPGEIPFLSNLAQPTHGVVTNIGISHIAQFASREAICEEKLGIAAGFPGGGGVLFLNGDDPLLAARRGVLAGQVIWFGTQPWCDVRAGQVDIREGGTSFVLTAAGGQTRVTLPVAGMHHVRNALAAAAVAQSLGVDLATAAAGMRQYRGVALRQQLRQGRGLHVIDDSYNASPDSVRSGLEALIAFPGGGRRVAVLADMYELGGYAQAAHEEAGRLAGELGIEILVAIGGMAAWIRDGAISVAGAKTRVYVCETLAEAYEVLAKTLAADDVVLVKGSRGMRADRLARAIVAGDPGELTRDESDG